MTLNSDGAFGVCIFVFTDKSSLPNSTQILTSTVVSFRNGLYVNLSQSEVEDFDRDGKVQPAFRSPALTVNSATAIGTITYACLFGSQFINLI